MISVGYRVNSKRGITFRKLATNLLTEYLIKGYSNTIFTKDCTVNYTMIQYIIKHIGDIYGT
ncbi:MAG TPA: virulence RhuM family protein [Rickettsia endosymbiont of Ceroptres masudai]|nr:virulence RhuM family protein [Rickettsia endosymbiont of Ceroptres masudai]